MKIHQKTDEHPSENKWTSIRKYLQKLFLDVHFLQMNIHQKILTNEHPSTGWRRSWWMYMWKETYIHVKRDLGTWAHTSKEEFCFWCSNISTHFKRDLCTCEERPIYMWRETICNEHPKKEGRGITLYNGCQFFCNSDVFSFEKEVGQTEVPKQRLIWSVCRCPGVCSCSQVSLHMYIGLFSHVHRSLLKCVLMLLHQKQNSSFEVCAHVPKSLFTCI